MLGRVGEVGVATDAALDLPGQVNGLRDGDHDVLGDMLVVGGIGLKLVNESADKRPADPTALDDVGGCLEHGSLGACGRLETVDSVALFL